MNLLRWPVRAEGFKLLDLGVVSGVAALLLTVMGTCLGHFGTKRQAIECQSNLKNWTGAFLAYPRDHDGWIVREGFHRQGSTYLNSWQEINSSGLTHAECEDSSEDVWYNALAEAYIPTVLPASRYASPSARPGFYGAVSRFHCPEVSLAAEYRDAAYPYALFSLTMNSELITPLNAPTIKFSTIEQCQGNVMIFLDSEIQPPSSSTASADRSQPRPGRPATAWLEFAPRHKGRGIVGFADGRVEGVLKSQVQGPGNENLVVWNPNLP